MAIQSISSQTAYVNSAGTNLDQKPDLKKFEDHCEDLRGKNIQGDPKKFDEVVSILKEKLQSEKPITLRDANDIINKLANEGSVEIDGTTYSINLKPHIESHACEDTSRAGDISTVNLLDADAKAKIAMLEANREGQKAILDLTEKLAKHSAKEALDQEAIEKTKEIAALLNQPKNAKI
jgi:hypothetical protein